MAGAAQQVSAVPDLPSSFPAVKVVPSIFWERVISTPPMYVAWPIWPHIKAPRPPENSREFSITEASLCAIPSARWRICNLGRAYAMSGDNTKAKSVYQDFLTLWKDADRDIPILKQAKTECTKLQ
jgi:hypothetical protein